MVQVSRSWKALVVAGIAGAAISTETCAQDQGTTIQSVLVPRGARPINEISFSPWRKTCFKVPDGGSICRISSVGTMSTGQQVIRADLIESGDKGAARLQLILPPVFFVPAGVKVRFGDDSTDIPYLWCVSNACIAAGRLEARLVEQMTALEQFSIECIDTSLLGISAAIPLANFQEAHQGVPARSYNEALEETQ